MPSALLLAGSAGVLLAMPVADVTAFEAYLVSGLLAATILAAGVGLLCVRSTRIFFTILTLAFAQVLHALFISGAAFRPFGDTGKGFFLIGSPL